MAGRGDRSEASAMEEEEMVEYNHGSAVKKRAKREGEAAAPAAEAVAEEEEEDYGGMSVERVFDGKPVPPWQQQLTFRAFVVSFFLSIIFSIIVMKLNLTTGIIPSLNVSAGLLGFFFANVWTVALDKCGLLRQPFTRQENTVIQICVVASSGIAFSGATTRGTVAAAVRSGRRMGKMGKKRG